MPLLSDDDRDQLFVTIRDSGHLGDGTFEAALDALLPSFRGLLPEVGRSAPKLFTALQQLNLAGRTIDCNLPMQVVLGTLVKLSPLAQVQSLSKRLLAVVEGAGGGGKVAFAAETPEAYVGDQAKRPRYCVFSIRMARTATGWHPARDAHYRPEP